MSRVATIDIGTNTTLLLVAEASSGTISVLEDRATITRLGRGIGKDGGLGQEGIDRTLAALSGYAVLARVHEAPIFAIGTEALPPGAQRSRFPVSGRGPAGHAGGSHRRRARGRADLSGCQAVLSRGCRPNHGGRRHRGRVHGNCRHASGCRDSCRSLPLGSVRLTERQHSSRSHRWLMKSPPCVPRSPSTWPKRPSLPKPTSPACWAWPELSRPLPPWRRICAATNPALVHGYRLTLPALEEQIESPAARLRPKASAKPWLVSTPFRADVILSGAIILGEIARRVGSAYVLVSDRGIRWGLLYEKLGNG